MEPSWQGRGYGRRLIRYAADEARRLQLPAISLYTNEAMAENIAMYTHMGFVETHRIDEEGFRRVYMKMSL